MATANPNQHAADACAVPAANTGRNISLAYSEKPIEVQLSFAFLDGRRLLAQALARGEAETSFEPGEARS